MSKRIRAYLGILAAVAAYYLVHEGAHLLAALYYDAFKEIRFLGFGIQIDIFPERMTQVQQGIFCLAGALATLLWGWGLIALAGRICKSASKIFKTCMWYISLTLLLPETAARTVFAAIGVAHGVVVWKYLLPKYTKSFQSFAG